MTGPERKRLAAAAGLTRWVRVRLTLTAAGLVLLFAGVGWKAYGLQVREGERYRQLAQRQHLRTVEVPAPRGAIYDATGKELAITAEIDSVFANPREVEDVAGTAAALARVLRLDVRDLESRLAAPRYFVWLERHVTPRTAALVRELGLPGIELTQEPRRFYPLKSLAGPVLGFAGLEGRGLDGVELALDKHLAGQRGKVAALRDASGAVMLAEAEISARAGSSATLTIDRSVQFIAERALERVVTVNRASGGVALVMDIPTGGLLAVANWPTYDPNRPGNYAERGARNRAVTDAYEIGSVMKVFTVAAALEEGAVRPGTIIDVEHGRYRVGRKTITDSYKDTELSVGGVLKRSSNVGAYKIARLIGRESLHRALLRYRFGQKTGVELPGERAGLVHPPTTWGETGLAAVSYGYNLMATPLQVLASFAAAGRGGVYLRPTILKEVRTTEGEIVPLPERPAERIMGTDAARDLLWMLESVFEKGPKGGTGRHLELPGFRAAGKSGTAHKVDLQHGGYQKDAYLSSFMGVAPLDAPRIAVLVIVDEPRAEEHYGALVAGPAFAEITSETLRYLGAVSDREPAPARPALAPAPEVAIEAGPEPPERAGEPDGEPRRREPAPVDETTHILIPDFRGLGVARALDLAREAGVHIQVQGTGRAVDQYPAPGFAPKPAECRVVFAPAADG